MLQIVEQKLSPEVFMALREKVDFQFYSWEDCSAALNNTFYTVEVRENGKTIGIARVVGDGRIVFFIKDVVVDPEYKGRGIGRMLMEALLAYIRRYACEKAYISLMATPGTEPFYEKFGFIRRPSPGLGSGMVLHTTANQKEAG